MKTIIITLLAFGGLIVNAFAYPIPPRPLRQLVIESEYIIIGYVVKTFDKKRNEGDLSSRVARIAVLENLQGNIIKDTIEINFNPNMVCPSPDNYFDSTYVISFVKKDTKSGKFYTHALSYGAKTLEKDEIEIYKQRISEIQQILKIPKTEKQKTETVEWLVKCAENEPTRWEGTYELSPERDFMSDYSQNKMQDFKTMINNDQKARLKKALLNTNGTVDFGLVDLVYKNNEIEIDKFLLTRLKNLKEDDYWIAEDFMYILKHKNTSNEMNKVLKEFKKLRFEYDKIDELGKTIQKFIKLIEK